MHAWLLILAIAAAPGSTAGGQSTVSDQGVTIHCAVRGSSYTWTVTNDDAPTITGFEISQPFLYNGVVPEGWQVEYRDGVFRAWTDSSYDGIERGDTARFAGQVGIQGAVLGEVPIRMTVAGDGPPIIVEAWGPRARPRSQVMLVAGLLVGLALLHTLLTRRRA